MAQAEAVPVHSGEHADFSRLVIDADSSDGWKLGRVEGGYEFRTARDDMNFAVGNVFEMIPRTRISQVGQPRPSALFLAVTCDCHVDAFELRGGRVVIDVKDGPAPRSAVFERPLDAPDVLGADIAEYPEAPLPEPSYVPPAMSFPYAPEASHPVEAHDEAASAAPASPIPDHKAAPVLPLPDLPPFVPGIAGTAFPSDPTTAARARAFEELILDQLARAGAQGLVEPLPLQPSRDTPIDPVKPAEPPPAPPPTAASDHVRVETAADRDRFAPDRATELPGTSCMTNEQLDLSSWGHLVDGRPDIASFRDGLSGEFDDIDPAMALTLARYYLFLGFGAEAAEQLGFVPNDEEDRDLLLAMATSMDRTGPGPWIPAFEQLQGCPTTAAMWALLSGPLPDPATDMDEVAALDGFSDLPEHIKRHLGPRLIDALRAAGSAEAAEIVRNRNDLAGTGGEVETAVAGARLDQSLGRPAAAEAGIEAVLHDVDPDAPAALLALAEIRLAAGESIDDDLLAALEAVSHNLRPRGRNRLCHRRVASEPW
jgi:hypothetical protein